MQNAAGGMVCAISSASVAGAASEANSVEVWDRLWGQEGDETWRKDALAEVYDRIVHLCPEGARVVDLGGGRGLLGRRLVEEKHCHVTVVDHSPVALEAAAEAGCGTYQTTIDLDTARELLEWMPDVVVSTETLEHLPRETSGSVIVFSSPAHEGLGVYHQDYTLPAVPGLWKYSWAATAPLASGSGKGIFEVRPQ